MKNISIITGGHVASTPRMLKAADCLQDAGYRVCFFSTEHVDWCMQASQRIAATRSWTWCPVDWSEHSAPRLFAQSRVRHKACVLAGHAIPWRLMPLRYLMSQALRVGPELLRAALHVPADLVIAGTSGGLAVGAIASQRNKCALILDLEDFHSAEQGEGTRRQRHQNQLIEQIERRVLLNANAVISSSSPIAREIARKYGIQSTVIHNVFPLPDTPACFERTDPNSLRLVWFSQSIGSGRGLDDVIHAAALVDFPITLGLVGATTPYCEHLLSEAVSRCSNLRVELLGTRTDDLEIINECRNYDVGLATETGVPLNRELCLSNKMATYMAAGLAIAATSTAGQQEPSHSLRDAVAYFRPGDSLRLAEIFRTWFSDPDLLPLAKRQSWRAASTRWNWAHPEEAGKLISLVHEVLNRS